MKWYGIHMNGVALAKSTAIKDSHTFHTLISLGIGNALEWYDWSIYATFGPLLGTQFFYGDRISKLLSAFAIFAVGFLFRPLGAILIGRFADNHGRKQSMLLSIGLSGAALFLIACTPARNHSGIFGPILVFIGRSLQGIAHGGELPTAQTYIAEKAPHDHRGLWASWIYVSGTIGNMTGTVLYAILAATLTHEQQEHFGWRIAFAFGGICALLSLLLRTKLSETDDFISSGEREKIFAYPRSSILVFAVTIGFTVFYYVWAISAPSYAQATLHISGLSATIASSLAQLVFIIALPLWGTLSDKVGHKKLVLLSIVLVMLAIFPLRILLTMAHDNAILFFLVQSVALILIAIEAAIVPIVYADMFPAENRVAGVAAPYSLATGLFGGTAPYLILLCSRYHHDMIFTSYNFVLMALGLIAILCLPVHNYRYNSRTIGTS